MNFSLIFAEKPDPKKELEKRKAKVRDEELYLKRLDGVKESFERMMTIPAVKRLSEQFRLIGVIPGKEPPANPAWFAARDKRNDMYTLKAWSKENSQSVAECGLERKLLAACECSFIDRLNFTFATREYEVCVLTYYKFGTLRRAVERQKSSFPLSTISRGRLSENALKLMAAQLILAIEYLHEVGYVYRNLTMDNIMIDDNKYIRITELGNARNLKDCKNPSVLNAPPRILPPDAIESRRCGKGDDWWALGILLYELLFGSHPFPGQGESYIQRLSLKVKQKFGWQRRLKFPRMTFVSSEARTLLTGLLQESVDRRLGMLSGGADDIKQEEWFNEISFVKVYLQQYEPGQMGYKIEPMEILPLPSEFEDCSKL